MKSANDDVVAIYAKMEPESAAARSATMDERIAAAILGKLKARRGERHSRRDGGGAREPARRPDLGAATREEIVMRRSLASLPLLATLALQAAGTVRASSCASRSFRRSAAASCRRRPPRFGRRTALCRSSADRTAAPRSTPSRASRRSGDIVTVIISINDKATFGNSTGRSQTTKDGFDNRLWLQQRLGLVDVQQPAEILGDLTRPRRPRDRATSTARADPGLGGRGGHRVLPNGNLVISGSQEVRVNYELRQLTVAGIVRPADISRNNTIAYDHIAEARISYGGRGRLSEVSSPPGASRSMTPSDPSRRAAAVSELPECHAPATRPPTSRR